MAGTIKLACDPAIITVPTDRILPMRTVTKEWRSGRKYQCIKASIQELGLIEPLVVYPQDRDGTTYMLLDGHSRLEVLKEIGEATAPCLVSHDDEAFTYNHKINHLTPIQEHFMILRAIKNGVSENRIATALSVDMEFVKRRTNLLDGICDEAVALLRDKSISAAAIREMRRAKPMRQIEIAELMRASHNYSAMYAKCLIAATPDDQLTEVRQKEVKGLSPDELARMEHEMELLTKEFRIVEDSHGQNTLNLVVVVGYLRKLLDNARVVRYLSQNFPELLAEFQKLVETRGLKE